jgi:hypothetical protein
MESSLLNARMKKPESVKDRRPAQTVTSIKMKASYKAALLSTFVFPGIGHLYLKRYWRGLVIMLFVCTGLGYLIWSVTVSALALLDDAMGKMQGGAVNPQALSGIVGSKIVTADPYNEIALYVIVCIWIFSIIDAYRIGRQKEVGRWPNTGG